MSNKKVAEEVAEGLKPETWELYSEVKLKVGEKEFDLTRTEPFIEHVLEVVSKVRQKKIADHRPIH